MKKILILLLAFACLTAVGLAEESADPSASPAASVLPAPEEIADSEEAPDSVVEEAPAEAAEPFTLWFEEGFGLTLPEGWLSYPVADVDRENGLKYILSDAAAHGWLYVQLTPTHLDSVEALGRLIEANPAFEKTGAPVFGDTDFVTFIDSAQNASCCATLWNDSVLLFAFTPQDDSDTALTASRLMGSFTH